MREYIFDMILAILKPPYFIHQSAKWCRNFEFNVIWTYICIWIYCRAVVRCENPNFLLGFGKIKTPKSHSEIIWSLLNFEFSWMNFLIWGCMWKHQFLISFHFWHFSWCHFHYIHNFPNNSIIANPWVFVPIPLKKVAWLALQTLRLENQH